MTKLYLMHDQFVDDQCLQEILVLHFPFTSVAAERKLGDL